jgi:hypothetical protein
MWAGEHEFLSISSMCISSCRSFSMMPEFSPRCNAPFAEKACCVLRIVYADRVRIAPNLSKDCASVLSQDR